MTENYINNYTVTLGANMTNVATSLTASAAAAVDGGFRILIGAELMEVTSGGLTTTWTVTRHIEGTSAVPHTSGDTITVVLTAGSLDQIVQDWHLTDTLANLPAASKAGRLFFPTDGLYEVARDNGSSWDFYCRGRKVGTMPSVTSINLAGINATFTASGAGGYIDSTGNTNFTTGGVAKAPANALFTFTVGLVASQPPTGSAALVGLLLSAGLTAGSAIRVFTYNQYTGGGFGPVYPDIQGWTAFNTGVGTTTVLNNTGAAPAVPHPIYFRVKEDATNRTYYVSHDNAQSFLQVAQEAVGAGFTTGGIGIGYTIGNTATPGRLYCVSWEETSP